MTPPPAIFASMPPSKPFRPHVKAAILFFAADINIPILIIYTQIQSLQEIHAFTARGAPVRKPRFPYLLFLCGSDVFRLYPAVHLALDFLARDALALVIQLFALAEAELDFD